MYPGDPAADWPRSREGVKLAGKATTQPPEVSVSHSKMLTTRRRKQHAKKQLAGAAKRAKKLKKSQVKTP